MFAPAYPFQLDMGGTDPGSASTLSLATPSEPCDIR
jgi:hypothetical protein